MLQTTPKLFQAQFDVITERLHKIKQCYEGKMWTFVEEHVTLQEADSCISVGFQFWWMTSGEAVEEFFASSGPLISHKLVCVASCSFAWWEQPWNMLLNILRLLSSQLEIDISFICISFIRKKPTQETCLLITLHHLVSLFHRALLAESAAPLWRRTHSASRTVSLPSVDRGEKEGELKTRVMRENTEAKRGAKGKFLHIKDTH